MLERLVTLGDEGDVWRERTKLSLQGSQTLIHCGAQDDTHRSAH
jgi:hypothetical protein